MELAALLPWRLAGGLAMTTPYHDKWSGLPDQMFRLMVNRGLPDTIGMRYLALDLANLRLTFRTTVC